MALLTSPPRHAAIIAGSIGEEQFVEGWHHREEDPRNGMAYRPGTGRSIFVLRRKPGAERLWLLLSGPVALAGRPLEGRVRIDGRRHQLPLAVDAWVLRRYPIDPRRGETLRVELILPEPAIPDRTLSNGDLRPLGWYLSAAWQE